MIQNLITALYVDENTYFNEGCGDAIFDCNGMDVTVIDLNLDGNFDEDYPDIIIPIRLLAWHMKFENLKKLKKRVK